MDDNPSAALAIETLYRLAADPEGWEELNAVLAAGAAEPDAAAVAASHDLARRVARPGEGAARDRDEIGWVALSARRRVLAANAAGRTAMAAGLGSAEAGAEIALTDPANADALVRAFDQARQRDGQVILRLDRGEDEGPCFAVLAPARAVAGIAAGLPDDALVLVFPAAEAAQRLWVSVRESFGLTAAEARLARKLHEGRSLAEAAEALGVSINTVRNQLRAVFDKMGLARQSDLIRALTELAALSGAMEGDGVEAPPLKRLLLADGRTLAYREYGDPAGRPFLSFHEGLGSSLLPPGTDSRARALSLRIVIADRPGFGRSDPRPDFSFDTVADDMVELCDRLGLETVRIGAVLSGAPSALQTAARLGKRAEFVLLTGGRPPRMLQRDSNPLVAFRTRIQTNPWVVAAFYAILRQRLSPGLVERLIRRSVAHSPGDQAWFEAHPECVGYVCGYVAECLSLSARGPVDEIKAFRQAGNLTPAGLTAPVIVWHGEEDAFAPLPDLLAYLGNKAGEVRVIPGIGHLMALKHWDEILERMAG